MLNKNNGNFEIEPPPLTPEKLLYFWDQSKIQYHPFSSLKKATCKKISKSSEPFAKNSQNVVTDGEYDGNIDSAYGRGIKIK